MKVLTDEETKLGRREFCMRRVPIISTPEHERFRILPNKKLNDIPEIRQALN